MTTELEKFKSVVGGIAIQHNASLSILGVDKTLFSHAIIECFLKNPEIVSSNPESLKIAIRRCCMDGLVPNGEEAVIVQKKDKDNPDGPKLCEYLPMKEGLLKMISRVLPDSKISSGIVKKCDKVEWYEGADADIKVRKGFPSSKEDNEILGAWARLEMADGRVYIQMMYKDELDRARNQSRTASGRVWNTWPEAMCEKSVVKRLMYRLRYLVRNKALLDLYNASLKEDSDYKQAEVVIDTSDKVKKITNEKVSVNKSIPWKQNTEPTPQPKLKPKVKQPDPVPAKEVSQPPPDNERLVPFDPYVEEF